MPVLLKTTLTKPCVCPRVSAAGIFHDDSEREYAYGPANGLPDTSFGTFSTSLMDEAKMKGWVVISMKGDWKWIFAFEP